MRHAGRLLLVLALVVVGHLFVPLPVAACSCVGPMDIVTGAGREPTTSVFTAIAGPRAGEQIPVTITRWFKGFPPVGPLFIQGGPPDDMCGGTSPPPGGEYLFVTYASETSRYTINGCSVQADTSTPDGAALLAGAVAAFGPGVVPAAPDDDTGLDDMIATAIPIALAGLLAVGLAIGAFGIRGRRRDKP
jgi:hypothetical protein